jgi:hypothetical protein
MVAGRNVFELRESPRLPEIYAFEPAAARGWESNRAARDGDQRRCGAFQTAEHRVGRDRNLNNAIATSIK